jgi:hypothetical protein
VSKHVFVLQRAFSVYVKSLLEHAACGWSPCFALKIAQIERVHLSFTKNLPNLDDLSYSDTDVWHLYVSLQLY